MKDKIKAHLGLGRFFALPCVVCAVLLGCTLGGSLSWLSAMVVLAAIFEMAYAHSFNTLLDYSWTGFDKGSEEERSKGKIYTKGQQAISAGQLTPRAVLLNGLGYLAISAIFIGIVAWKVSPIIWAIWGVTTLCTFWYSWGKLHYQCELALGVGFGPLAVLLGMASQPNPDFLTAFLSGIPFLLMWGFAMETYDQWTDWEVNVPRGLKNLGALIGQYRVSPALFVGWLIAMAYLAQLVLITADILKPLTGLSFCSIPLFAYGLALIEGKPKNGIIIVLLGCFIYMALLVIGEVV